MSLAIRRPAEEPAKTGPQRTVDRFLEMTTILERAQGCLLGQLAGDALGSLVEFRDPETIRSMYPDGVRELADGRAELMTKDGL